MGLKGSKLMSPNQNPKPHNWLQKFVCMYVRTYVRMYVCVCDKVACERWCVCVCESDVSAWQCRYLFFASAAMWSALHAAALRTWNGLNEVFHDLLCSMRCNEMCYVTAAPVLQPRIRRWWHRGKVPGRKSVEHECSWLSMQLWKTSAERMPVKARHSHSGKHNGYDANCAGFSKDVKQPQSSETHRRREHSHRCRFARHLHTLLPTLGQSSCSCGHRLVDSLSGHRRVTNLDVTLCHTCHAKMPRRHARPGRAQTRPKRATECHECHACHAKRRWM